MNDADALALAKKERIPGADEQALAVERALIGGCLLDTRGCREWPSLPPSRFYLLKHQWIWQAMLDLTEVTDHPDLVLLAAELRRTELLDDVGGPVYLAGLELEGMCAVDLQRYGAIVRQGAAERDRQKLAAALLAHPEGSEQVEAILRALEEQPGRSEPLTSVFPRLEEDRRGSLIDVGFEGLQLRVGTVTAVGGRTSHGKTAFMCHISKAIARQDISVDYITLEDPAEAIAARLLAGEARRSLYYIRMSRLASVDLERPRNALEMLPISVTSVPGCRETAVIGAVAASRAQVIMVDHLQQIGLEGADDESRNHVIERVMGRLGAIARRDSKAIALGCQLSREMDKQKRQPVMADLKDSGAIEQSARAVWLLYWKAKHRAEPTTAEMADYLVKLEKVSEGPTFPKWLKWDPKSGYFWDPKVEPEVPDW